MPSFSAHRLKANFTPQERNNVILYIFGIMMYKFAFETLGNAIGLMAQERFPKDKVIIYL
jgi:hypothetical protein